MSVTHGSAVCDEKSRRPRVSEAWTVSSPIEESLYNADYGVERQSHLGSGSRPRFRRTAGAGTRWRRGRH